MCTSWLHTMSITTCGCALQVDIPFHIQGDVVRVIDDIATVHGLQTVGPGWVDEMALVRITYIHVGLRFQVAESSTFFARRVYRFVG